MITLGDASAPAPTRAESLYVNGFELALSNSDVMVTLMMAGEAKLRVHLSFTSAKTLSSALTQLTETLERVTDRKIMDMGEVGLGLEKLATEMPTGASH